jgi:hypothetical protein
MLFSLLIMRVYPYDIRAYQAAKGTDFSCDALIDFLESIERFLRRLDIYTQIPHESTLDEMVVKIIIELLSTLALATQKIKQGRSSGSVLIDVLPYSMKRSEVRKERFWRARRRGGPATAGPTDARSGSDDRSGDTQSHPWSCSEYECGYKR